MGLRKGNRKAKKNVPQTVDKLTTTADLPTIDAKYENDLDGRFQWREGLHVDHIFEEEIEMIRILRQQVPQLAGESDKFIATFLFSRRHGI